MYVSARHLLGYPVTLPPHRHDEASILGTVESITINPKTMQVDGFLLGRVHGMAQNQLYLPRECVIDVTEHNIRVHKRFIKKPPETRRILGLSAWTTQPKMLVGFVYDLHFSLETGMIESFVIHQLLRTWRIPPTAVERITTRSLLIDNDTTVKLKITSYPSEC